MAKCALLPYEQYYFDSYCSQIQRKLDDYHAKNDKRVEGKYAEVESVRLKCSSGSSSSSSSSSSNNNSTLYSGLCLMEPPVKRVSRIIGPLRQKTKMDT